MDINYSAHQVFLRLSDNSLDDKRAREMALIQLELSLEYCENLFNEKEWLLQQANESGRQKFKLIGRVNTSGLELMEWCDDAFNFSGMCSNIELDKTCKDGDYLKRTYTLEELPKVIDRALKWHDGNKKLNHKFNSTALHIMAVD